VEEVLPVESVEEHFELSRLGGIPFTGCFLRRMVRVGYEDSCAKAALSLS
jgi:hypothetical protein